MSPTGHEAWVSDRNSPQKSCLSPRRRFASLPQPRCQTKVWRHPILAKGGLVSQHSGRVKTIPVTRVSVCVLRCDQIGPTARPLKRPACADLNEADLQLCDPWDSNPSSPCPDKQKRSRASCVVSLRSLFLLWVSAPWSESHRRAWSGRADWCKCHPQGGGRRPFLLWP